MVIWLHNNHVYFSNNWTLMCSSLGTRWWCGNTAHSVLPKRHASRWTQQQTKNSLIEVGLRRPCLHTFSVKAWWRDGIGHSETVLTQACRILVSDHSVSSSARPHESFSSSQSRHQPMVLPGRSQWVTPGFRSWKGRGGNVQWPGDVGATNYCISAMDRTKYYWLRCVKIALT